jgi:hypothetical protein
MIQKLCLSVVGVDAISVIALAARYPAETLSLNSPQIVIALFSTLGTLAVAVFLAIQNSAIKSIRIDVREQLDAVMKRIDDKYPTKELLNAKTEGLERLIRQLIDTRELAAHTGSDDETTGGS